MYIHSPGGMVYAGLAIYDTMNLIRAEVSTIAIGVTASMGTVLLAAGENGKRFALPNSTIHMHQALGGGSGQASDVQIQAQELMRNNLKIREILANATAQPMERIERDTDRDFYMSADEAKAYGLVDEVLSKQMG